MKTNNRKKNRTSLEGNKKQEILISTVLSDSLVSDLSALWLLDVLNKHSCNVAESENELMTLVIRWCKLHRQYTNDETMDTILRSVRLCRLSQWYIEEILCTYHSMSIELKNELLKFIKTGEKSAGIVESWMLPPRRFMEGETTIELQGLTPNDVIKTDFFEKKTAGIIRHPSKYVPFLGIMAASGFLFNPFVPIVKVCLKFSFDDDDEILNVDGCKYKIQMEYCGNRNTFESVSTNGIQCFSYNIMEGQGDDDFFDRLRTLSIKIFLNK